MNTFSKIFKGGIHLLYVVLHAHVTVYCRTHQKDDLRIELQSTYGKHFKEGRNSIIPY